ncbi:MAG: FkbM family methyltransferase [Rugosibacter sp.]|nr:MAG: FkbM family methyltransferase [Rugosibacter sp.]
MKLDFLKQTAAKIADVILSNNEFSGLHEIRHLKKTFNLLDIDCVFDVGANSGQYAAMLRKRVGFSGLIISFEPNPALYPELLKRSKFDENWHVFNSALSDAEGSLPFNIMAESQFSSFKEPNTEEYTGLSYLNKVREVVSVQCYRLETLFNELQKNYGFVKPFLKMDTQGNDLLVFNGAKGILHEIRGLQSELSFKRLYKDSPSYHDALVEYTNAGFELSALVPNNAGHFPLLLEMDCIMINKRFLEKK